MKLLIGFIALVALAEDKPITLTAEDQVAILSATVALLSAQTQFLSLQMQLPELAKARDAEIAKLKAKCGTNLITDSKGLLQCDKPSTIINKKGREFTR